MKKIKPLKLKISGLNSFIEEQTIDFEELTKLGLFGIFGPTGSGKSTILDAITLSLYGEIPRAGKDLSGIINSNKDQASIYYEFKIGNKNNRKKYFVQRQFQRNKEGKIRTKSVKLCDISTEASPLILEEKVNEVNNKVEEILGLKSNDFTRSVVLPQGSFSEFLQLSGKEKRDMLERIFALQEYGSHLSLKIRGEKKKIGEEITFLKGNILAYEGVSKEVNEDLLKRIKTLEDNYKKLKEQREEIDTKYESYKKVWQLQIEYKEEGRKKEILETEKKHIEQQKIQYELAQRAKSIKPYIESQREVEKRLRDKRIDLNENEKKLNKTNIQLEKLEEQWQIIQKKSHEDLPQLLSTQGKLEEALEKESKIENLRKTWRSVHLKEKDFLDQWDKEKKGLEKTQKSLNRCNEELKEVREKKEELTLSQEYKDQLYKGYELEREYHDLIQEYKDKQNKIMDTKEKELEPLLKNFKALENEKESLEENLKAQEERQTKIKMEIDKIKNQNMAAHLAQNLLEREECPVCGSKDHPKMAYYENEDKIEGLEKELEEIVYSQEKIKAILEKHISRITILKEQRGLKEGFIEQWEKEIEKTKETLSSLEKRYHALKTTLQTENIQGLFKEVRLKEKELEDLHKKEALLQEKREKEETRREKSKERIRDIESECIKIKGNKEHIKSSVQELKDAIDRICKGKDPKEEIENLKNEINQIKDTYKKIKESHEETTKTNNLLKNNQRGYEESVKELENQRIKGEKTLQKMLKENAFKEREEVEAVFKNPKEMEEIKKIIEEYEKKWTSLLENIKRLEKSLEDKRISERQWMEIQENRDNLLKALEETNNTLVEKRAEQRDIQDKLNKLNKILEEKKILDHQYGILEDLDKLFQGNKFVEFISLRQLRYIAREASEQLRKITRGRYALELDVEGNFVMRDDFNGGVRRGTQTLSGGETFVTSLALALSLSSHIQLKGTAPLEFFFLDEGFGTLDAELLEVVMDSLEKLHSEGFSVGLISHVEELKLRIPRRLIVDPAEAGGKGTRVNLEIG